MIKQGFLIPVYNHGKTLGAVISHLVKFNLPILIVDDGNDEENKKLISLAIKDNSLVTLIVNKKNCGKGKSVCNAIKVAHKMGITNLFQIDADGQHDTVCCKEFLDVSNENPESLICGYPIFDESVPGKRKSGRKISNAYASFVTLSSGIKDAMCGYRIYPVEKFYKICKHSYIDSHMGFDTEILVRLIWSCVPVIYMGVHVSYPLDGKSNFRMFRDNVHISLMFARMTIGMILRLPILVARKIRGCKNGK